MPSEPHGLSVDRHVSLLAFAEAVRRDPRAWSNSFASRVPYPRSSRNKLSEFRILHHATSYPSSVSFITQQAIRVPYPSSRQKLSEFRILHKDTEYSLSSSVSFTPEAIRRDPRPHAYLEHAARSTDTTPLPVARRCARMITGGQAARWPLHQQCRRKNHHRPLRRSESAASSWQPPLDPDHRHLLIHGPEAISYESLKLTAAT